MSKGKKLRHFYFSNILKKPNKTYIITTENKIEKTKERRKNERRKKNG